MIGTGVVGVSTRTCVVGQEATKAAVKGEKGNEAKGSKKGSTGDRLPANYTKIGLSEEQRKKIYEVQNRYEAQIDTLEKQIADLKEKRKADVESILTPDQQKALQSANEESKKKSAEKKKVGEAKAEEAKKGDK